jgi:hypothetical protein
MAGGAGREVPGEYLKFDVGEREREAVGRFFQSERGAGEAEWAGKSKWQIANSRGQMKRRRLPQMGQIGPDASWTERRNVAPGGQHCSLLFAHLLI